MADIAIYALVGGITSLQERMSNFRSPVIPLSRTSTPPAPPPIPPHISRSADAQFLEGTLTEHGLELAHYSWATRHAALALRQYALKDAVQKSASSSFPSLDLHRLGNPRADAPPPPPQQTSSAAGPASCAGSKAPTTCARCGSPSTRRPGSRSASRAPLSGAPPSTSRR